MKSEHVIFFTQHFPEKLRGAYVAARKHFCGQAHSLTLIQDIDKFPSLRPKVKKALVVLSADAWLVAVRQYPHISLFNYFGLIHVIVHALNENGYTVDIVELKETFKPSGKIYDLFVGHGGNCRAAIETLPPETPIFQYISGAHWERFETESKERYARFAASRQIPQPRRFSRDMSKIATGEEYLLNQADCLFSISCPRMMAGFGYHSEKFFITGLGAYLDPKLDISHEQKDFKEGSKNFIYVGGTAGNIQKGLDVLLECFARCPDLHLYIYCKVEREISNHYSAELNNPNIHYIYHYRWPVFSRKLKTLMKGVNFTIHAPINTGLGTAFSASLAAGLIPVGYVDYDFDQDFSILSDGWDVDCLAETIVRASNKSQDWCEKASLAARRIHQTDFSDKAVRSKFLELFSEENVERVKAKKVLQAGARNFQNRPLNNTP